MQKQLTVFADTTYVNRSLPTASWYDVYVLHAGTYDFTEQNGYATARVDATLTESHRVDRLLHLSKANNTTPNIEQPVYLGTHSFSVKIGPWGFPEDRFGWVGEPGTPIPTEAEIATLHQAIRDAESAAYAAETAVPFAERDHDALRHGREAERARLVAALVEQIAAQ